MAQARVGTHSWLYTPAEVSLPVHLAEKSKRKSTQLVVSPSSPTPSALGVSPGSPPARGCFGPFRPGEVGAGGAVTKAKSWILGGSDLVLPRGKGMVGLPNRSPASIGRVGFCEPVRRTPGIGAKGSRSGGGYCGLAGGLYAG